MCIYFMLYMCIFQKIYLSHFKMTPDFQKLGETLGSMPVGPNVVAKKVLNSGDNKDDLPTFHLWPGLMLALQRQEPR